MTALNNNKETSINPMIIMDKAIDMSTRLSGSQFPVSIFPAKIQRIIKEVHECHSFPTDYISAAILTALAVGIGNTHLAQMKQGGLKVLSYTWLLSEDQEPTRATHLASL